MYYLLLVFFLDHCFCWLTIFASVMEEWVDLRHVWSVLVQLTAVPRWKMFKKTEEFWKSDPSIEKCVITNVKKL